MTYAAFPPAFRTDVALPHDNSRTRHRRVARLQRLPRRLGVVGLLEEMRVHVEGDRRAGVPELARDEHGIEPLGDEERGERMAQRMEREPALPVQASRLDGRAERFPGIAVVGPLPVGL